MNTVKPLKSRCLKTTDGEGHHVCTSCRRRYVFPEVVSYCRHGICHVCELKTVGLWEDGDAAEEYQEIEAGNLPLLVE